MAREIIIVPNVGPKGKKRDVSAQVIGSKNFVFVPYVNAFLRKVTKGSARATVKTSIVMQRSAQKNSPHRTGTNSRSIRRRTRGNSTIVFTTSGYGFWLEVIDRIYERGHKGYLREAWMKGVEAYPGFIREALNKLPQINPPRPQV